MTGVFFRFLAVGAGVTPLIALLLAATPLLGRRYAASLNRGIWLAVAIRLLLPIQMGLPQILTVPLPQAEESISLPWVDSEPLWAPPASLSGGAYGQDAPPPVAAEQTPQPGRVTDTAPAMWQLAGWLWLAGGCGYLTVHLIGSVRESRRFRRWSRPPSPRWRELFRRQREALEIRRSIPLEVSPAVDSPVLTGLLRPRITLPDRDMDEAALEIVLRHELLHYKRRDLWYKLAMVAAGAVHWFNPLVHLMIARSHTDLELACDGAVLQQADGAARRHYGLVVLDTMTGCRTRGTLHTRFGSGRRQVMRRFRAIAVGGVGKRGLAVLWAVALLVFLAGGLVACDGSRAPGEEISVSQEPQSADVSEPQEDQQPAGVAAQSDEHPLPPYHTRQDIQDSPEWGPDRTNRVLEFWNNLDLVLKRQTAGRRLRLEMDGRLEAAAASSNDTPAALEGIWPLDWNGTEYQIAYRHRDSDFFPGVLFFGSENVLFLNRSVLAHLDGTVVEVEHDEDQGLGRYVIVDHGGGVITLYALCSEILVDPGDWVEQGQAIARTGHSGVAEYNSLYFEKRVDGQLADSLDEFDRTYGGLFENPTIVHMSMESIELLMDPSPDANPAFYSLFVINPLESQPEDVAVFIWPTVSGRATTYSGHNGVDIAPGGAGHPIYAAASGTVTRVVNGYTGYGHYIIIDHGNGYQTLYAQNNANYVSVGDYVEQGQVIAAVGSTGNAYGNHLHFEVRYNGRFMNPYDYIGTSNG